MRGRIESGQLVTIEPASFSELALDDVIFVRYKGNFLLHLVKELSADGVLIGNNLGKINGWVSASDVLGRVASVSD